MPSIDIVDPTAISERLEAVRERIAAACARCGRSPEEVTLVGVTKTFPVEAVVAAREAGLTHFGENRVQELVEKAEAVPGHVRGGDVSWYMIGHLQRNKAKDVVDYADYFQALDSPRLAKELSKRAAQEDRVIPCLVQINVSGEESKYGIAPEDAHSFIDSIRRFEHLHVTGLMTIASYVENPEEVRSEFQRLRDLFETYDASGAANIEMRHLSMGMSGDFEVAIEEGATHVRVGSAIFGTRDQ